MTKMKTAAKQPKKLIASPMFGSKMALKGMIKCSENLVPFSHCGNYRTFFFTICCKNFVKAMVLYISKEITISI